MSHAPVYVGNYEYDADERELERAFDKYGRVKSIEYKSGYCFVHFEDERDADECIRELSGREWGRKGRRLRVEFAKNDARVRERESKRREAADPNNSLFVAGFDPRTINESMLRDAFDPFGSLKRCEVKKTYAFIEYENLDDAKDALNQMHGKKIDGREITVEYGNAKPERRERDRGGVRDRGGSGGGRYDDRRDRGGRGRYDDRNGRDRGYGGRDRYEDRGYSGGNGGSGRDRGRYDDRRGGYGGGGRDRSRSYERRRDDRDRRGRRSPSFDRKDRTRSPIGRRGRSPVRRSPPPAVADRRRSRSPLHSPGRDEMRGASPPRRGDSPSRSRSPMRDDE